MPGSEHYERQYQQRALRAAKRRAAQLGYQLAPMSDAPDHATHEPPSAPIAARRLWLVRSPANMRVLRTGKLGDPGQVWG